MTFPFSSAIHEFPDDMFSNSERKSGAILLHIVAVRWDAAVVDLKNRSLFQVGMTKSNVLDYTTTIYRP